MTNLAYGVQLRVATVTNSVAKFKINMHLTERGPLPDKHVFLKSIVDDTDPKQDNLKRVCKVGDLVTYPKNRDEALRKRIPYWRDVGLTKMYSSITKATVAAEFLKEKVNELVTAYADYTDNFKAIPGEFLTFPQKDMGVLQPMIEDYSDKVDERKDKAKELGEIKDKCEKTHAEFADTLVALSRIRGAKEALQTGRAALNIAHSAMVTKGQAGADIAGTIEMALALWESVQDNATTVVRDAMEPSLDNPTGSLYDTFHTDYKNKLSDFKKSTTSLASQIANIEMEITSLGANESELKIKRDELLQAKEECAGEIASAAAELNALEQQEADLLDQVQSLCPDFTPEST